MPDEYPPYPGPDTPPDDELATDPWGWLYRDEPAAPRSSGDDAAQPSTRPDSDAAGRPDDPADAPPTFVAPGPAWQETPADPDVGQAYPTQPYAPESYGGESYAGGAAAGATDAAAAFAPDEQPQRRRKGGLVAAIIVGALVLVAVLIVVLVMVFRSLGGPPGSMPYHATNTPKSSSTGGPSQQPSGPPTYDGNVAPLAATGASAKCVAADAKDGAGNTVSYAPGNATDEDPATAWRCDGDGKGQSISVQLPHDSTVARVGLINGYAKVDPKSHEQRYGEYRRITEVRWTFSNGATFDQHLSDGVQAVQHMNIPVQKGVDEVTVTIESSTDPGQGDSSRDAVLISTIQVGKPA